MGFDRLSNSSSDLPACVPLPMATRRKRKRGRQFRDLIYLFQPCLREARSEFPILAILHLTFFQFLLAFISDFDNFKISESFIRIYNWYNYLNQSFSLHMK